MGRNRGEVGGVVATAAICEKLFQFKFLLQFHSKNLEIELSYDQCMIIAYPPNDISFFFIEIDVNTILMSAESCL